MIPDRFGESAPFSLGVEEELMILDAATYEPVPAVSTLVAEADGLELPGRLKTELHASVVELNTGVCGSAEEALAALRELRAAAAAIAARNDLRIAAAGSHPIARPEELDIVPEPRYLEFVEYAGSSARRQAVSGLHVHIGLPDREQCWRTLDAVLPWLPLVLALSANSPYLAGAETGLASTRAEVLALLPRSSAPPALGSYDGWERHVERLGRLRVPSDYTAIWWDVRPHPRFGTLEIRMPDQPTSVELSGAFVALLQALCAAAPDGEADSGSRGIYEENRWAALRFGPRARLIHPREERLVPVDELADELLELVEPAARRLGGDCLLGALDGAWCEGDRQLETGRSRGLEAVCAELADRSVDSR